MGGDGSVIHVRCDEALKQSAKRAAAFNDQSMSDWVRETLREAAADDLPEEVQPEN